jgi:hypothetical protein
MRVDRYAIGHQTKCSERCPTDEEMFCISISCSVVGRPADETAKMLYSLAEFY